MWGVPTMGEREQSAAKAGLGRSESPSPSHRGFAAAVFCLAVSMAACSQSVQPSARSTTAPSPPAPDGSAVVRATPSEPGRPTQTAPAANSGPRSPFARQPTAVATPTGRSTSGQPAFGPARSISGNCSGFEATVTPDDETAPLAGFVHCVDGRIRYAQLVRGRWQLTITPYSGSVLAGAASGNRRVVLFEDGGDGFARVGQGSTAGGFDPPTIVGQAMTLGTATVVAAGSDWRAIWIEKGVDGASSNMYEASSVFARRRIPTGTGLSTSPTLGLASSTRAISLAYDIQTAGGEHALTFQTATSLSTEFSTARVLESTRSALRPRIAVAGNRTYVGFLADRIPTVAEVADGQTLTHRQGFFTDEGASDVRLSVSASVPTFAWSAPRGVEGDGTDIDCAQLLSGGWARQRALAPKPMATAYLLGLITRQGRATVIALDGVLLSRTQGD